MRYNNDLTASVEAYIKETLLEKILKANEGLALCETAQEVMNYLCDNSTVNTPEFVLRRYIYKYHAELFFKVDNYAELAEDFYRNWSQDILHELAKELSRISKNDHKLNISTKTWLDYLTGTLVRKRVRVFQIAIILQMDVESTLELLMAYDMEPYSVRNPIELICMFCQNNPNKYTWRHVELIFECFELGKGEKILEKQEPTEGMTRVIQNELDKIFRSDLPDSDTEQMLIQYMIDNANEFKSFIKGKKEVYLPGYSLTRMNKFKKLMKYLAVLYPGYYATQEETDLKVLFKDIDNANDGYPKLQDLKRAMFQTQDWNFEIWNIPEKEKGEKDFRNFVYYSFCNNYSNHLWAIERLREGGENIEFFERKDALLFSYFLINGYLNLLNADEITKNKAIETLLENGDEFDESVSMIFESLEELDEYDSLQRYDTMWQCINIILKEMDYPILYVPSAFDRFVVLSLMSVSPDELTPLILNQANLEDAME